MSKLLAVRVGIGLSITLVPTAISSAQLSPSCTFDRPIKVWKLSTAENALPEQVEVGISELDGCEAWIDPNWPHPLPTGQVNDLDWAPRIIIRPKNEPRNNDADYSMTWWVYRADTGERLDIDSITFIGTPTEAFADADGWPQPGREYRLIVAGPPELAPWDRPDSNAESVGFLQDGVLTHGARHIREVRGYGAGAYYFENAAETIPILDPRPKIGPVDGPNDPLGNFRYFKPTEPRTFPPQAQGPSQKEWSYRIRMRIGVTGDLGTVESGDIARIEARR
ncbi:MAG: hypothetical protein MUE97_02795, partial [Phycisphaerales bacterium]|nr:hypothetical protein [Phycisphaerales bacterium]